ncbi:MAG: rod shape-determining protein MreC [Acidimicrobiales bacterium]
MIQARRSSGSKLTLVILLLASLTIITLDFRGYTSGIVGKAKAVAHEAFMPLQAGVSGALRPVGSYFDGVFQTGALSQENQRLRSENASLREKLLSTSAMREQLRQITSLERLPFAGSIPKVTAQVISGSNSDFESTIELNKGTSSGIAVGMPVAGSGGLLGTVIDVWRSGSTVRMLTDPRSSVGVRLGAGGPYAMVAGTGNARLLTVDYVAPGTKLAKGTPVYTSGLNSAIFPPGIPVGSITSVSGTTNASGDESVQATLYASLTGIQYVDVLQWVQGTTRP